VGSGSAGATDSGEDDMNTSPSGGAGAASRLYPASVRDRLSPPPAHQDPSRGEGENPPSPPEPPKAHAGRVTSFSVEDILSPSKFVGGGGKPRVWHPWGDRPSPGAIRSGDSDSGTFTLF
jgi:hypothetical protein